MRRLTALLAAALALLAVAAAPAPAAEIVTWTIDSRHVDIRTARLGFSANTANRYPRTPRDALRVNVYLPDGYDGRTRFPILYLLHSYGWGYDYWAQPDGGNIGEFAADFPGIIVMPEGARGYSIDWWNGGRRGDPAWQSFVLDEVIELAESRLQIRSGRRWRAISGFSMGGFGAAKLAALRPDYFGSVAALSGPLSIRHPDLAQSINALEVTYTPLAGDPNPVPATTRDIIGDFDQQAFYWEGNDPLALVANLRDTRVFTTVGDGNYYDERDRRSAATGFASGSEPFIRDLNREFAEAARGVPLRDFTYLEHAGSHSNYMSGVELRQAIEWGLFREPPDEPRSWTYSTVAPRGRMWDLTFEFADPPEILETFRRDGDTLSADGSGTVTVRGTDCSFTAELPFRRSLSTCRATAGGPRRERLRLRVSPRRVAARRRTRFRFRVTDARGRPVAGARVAIRSRRARTGRRGRARMVRRFYRPGRYRVWARRAGYLPARGQVRVVAPTRRAR